MTDARTARILAPMNRKRTTGSPDVPTLSVRPGEVPPPHSPEAETALLGLLRHAARQLQNELDNRLRWFGGLVEPALIVGMGVVVLTIVLAVLMPIIEMNNVMAR